MASHKSSRDPADELNSPSLPARSRQFAPIIRTENDSQGSRDTTQQSRTPDTQSRNIYGWPKSPLTVLFLLANWEVQVLLDITRRQLRVQQLTMAKKSEPTVAHPLSTRNLSKDPPKSQLLYGERHPNPIEDKSSL